MCKTSLKINLENLHEEPYASVICYPRLTLKELQRRLVELERLGVKAVEFGGEKEAFGVKVLGKGCVGIVTTAYIDGKKIALKIRRVDADRAKMQNEAALLRKANSFSVGPKFLAATKNFLLMQFIDGELLPKWLSKHRQKAVVKKVLRDVLEQCWRLDTAGLDHGELSYAPKHIIVDKKNVPFIVDFESASLNRKPSNVTSICHFLFFSGSVAAETAEIFGKKDKEQALEALRSYKKFMTRENFDNILKVFIF